MEVLGITSLTRIYTVVYIFIKCFVPRNHLKPILLFFPSPEFILDAQWRTLSSDSTARETNSNYK